jgi:glycosyltransferase 2 family protein
VKSSTRILISLALTVAFLALFLRSFDLHAAWQSLRGASPWLLAAAVALNVLCYPVRAWRWRHLMAPIRENIGFYNLNSTTFIGFMVSYLVPFRLGEVVRPVMLARRERLSSSAAIATIALERLFDAMTVMFLFLVFSLSAHGRAILALPEGGARSHAVVLLRQGALGATLLVAIGLPLVMALVIFPQQFIGALHRMNKGGPGTRFGRVITVLDQFLGGLGSLKRGRELTAIIGSSFAMWLLIDLSVWLGLRAFDLPLQFLDTFLLMVALTVGISVPTPGGVGPYEYFCSISLSQVWGVPAAVAGAVAVTQHAIAMLPPIVVGLLFMWRDGVRPAEVRTLAHSAPPPSAAPAAPGAPGGRS